MMFDKQLTSRIVRQETPPCRRTRLGIDLHLHTSAKGTAVSLKDLDLKVFPGEIVGVAGVSGNGQKELCDAILGMEKIISGKKLIERQRFYPHIHRQNAEIWLGLHPGKSA